MVGPGLHHCVARALVSIGVLFDVTGILVTRSRFGSTLGSPLRIPRSQPAVCVVYGMGVDVTGYVVLRVGRGLG